MGANDTMEQLEVARAYIAEVEAERDAERKRAERAELLNQITQDEFRQVGALRARVAELEAENRRLLVAGEPARRRRRRLASTGDALREARAKALEDAATYFENEVGLTEFDEQTSRDGRHWSYLEDAWNQQGAYMDWLRSRAASIREGDPR